MELKVFDNGEKLTFHNGWWHGSNTAFVHLQKSKVTIIALGNNTIIALGNKFSRRVYSALTLSSLFEDFPLEREKLNKLMNKETDTTKENHDAAAESTE